MRPLPSFLLLCASYGVTAIVYGFPSGKNGLDYCIAEADTTSDIDDSVDHHGTSTMDKPCTMYVSHHLGAWRVRAQPYAG